MPRKQPVDISETIFRPTPLIEHYRRTVGFLEAHHAHLVDAGAPKRELATLAETLKKMRAIVAMSEIFPPDTPQPETAPELPEQPLVTPGSEGAIAEIFNIALGDSP